MRNLYSAIERHFNADGRLKRLARRLYHGLAGADAKSVREHVDLTCTKAIDFDTFDTDETDYDLTFTVKGHGPKPERVAVIMDEIRRAFDDTLMADGRTELGIMRFAGSSGPALADGNYEGSLDYQITVARRKKQPMTRGA